MTRVELGSVVEELLQPAAHKIASMSIASAVAFLASSEARYITGQTLTVDGGMVM